MVVKETAKNYELRERIDQMKCGKKRQEKGQRLNRQTEEKREKKKVVHEMNYIFFNTETESEKDRETFESSLGLFFLYGNKNSCFTKNFQLQGFPLPRISTTVNYLNT